MNRLHGIGCARRAGFYIGHREMRSVRDGVLDHGQSVMSRSQSGAGLVRRVVSRRYEEYLVEGQNLLRVCGHRQMAAMNRVKGTAQYPDASV